MYDFCFMTEDAWVFFLVVCVAEQVNHYNQRLFISR